MGADAEMTDAEVPAATQPPAATAATDDAPTPLSPDVVAAVGLTKNAGDAIAPNDDALAFAKRKATLAKKSQAKKRANKRAIASDDEMDAADDEAEVEDHGVMSDDDDAGDAERKPKPDASSKPKLKTLKGDPSFVHYGGDVYVQSTQRPGGGTFDLVFQLYDADGEYYPFSNCDARGLYAPGKEVPLLRSKVAVARYLERDGMTEEDLRVVEMEASAFRASELAAATPAFIIPREPRASRAAAAKKPLRDLDSDEELSDLLESDEERAGGGYESESEPLEKIEKIVYALEATEVDEEELEKHGADDAVAAGAEARRKAAVAKGKKVWLYCVKWEGCSYRRRSWETEAGINAAYKASGKLQGFKRRLAKDPDACTEPFHPDYLVVDRIIDEREAIPEDEDDEDEEDDEEAPEEAPEKKKGKGKKAAASEDSSSEEEEEAEPGTQYLVKWRGLGYSESTWEAAEDLDSPEDLEAIRLFERRNDLKAKKAVHQAAAERAKSGAKPAVKPEPPAFKNGMALRDYQVTSFEWMVGNYRRRHNVILGDEMGLGKTAQCISVMEHVRTRQLRAPRPFLVVAPLTTLGHWKREMEKWTEMNVVVLDGNAEDRRVCEETEFYFESRGSKGPAKFDVLLVSFETARRLTDLIAQFEWALCVVDEAHKLKDVNSQTTQAVMEIGYDWLLLLTGTPIQNNVRELFGMMHVLDPEQYPSWEEFQDEFCDGGREVDAEQVMRLREVLKPRMLRRMKEDVETIPAKEEIVVWVELTPEQRNYYRAIYEKQVHVLLEGNKGKNVPQLRNLCMELRKVCNHPFLCDGIEQDYTDKRKRAIEAAAEKAAADAVAAAEKAGLPAPAPPPPPTMPSNLELLTASSGKMVLVSKLLPKLKSQGKKVLIFSQFTIVLDILEDYLTMMNFEFERLDGSTAQADRQAGIDRFNSPDRGFVYLLSTRAGGMGITLTAADTAIIYDSDWNPQNDLQAMARCHRIGQTKEVKVYRLVTKATYEQSLFETSAKKYGLDEAVLGGGDSPTGGSGSLKEDAKKINQLLKFGVHGALRDQSGEEAAAFANEDIDQILGSRAEHRAIGSRAGNTFSTAVFSAGADDAAADAEDFWTNALPEAAKEAMERAANPDPHHGLDARFRVEGPRKRKGMYDSYKEGANGLVGKRRRRGDDDDYSEEYDEDSDRETRGAKRASANAKKKELSEAQKKARNEAWRDHELKALEDAIYSFGVGVDGGCARAVKAAELSRPFAEVKAVALALTDMMDRAGKVCKARFDELEKAAAEAGPVQRCKVCESMKKGRCGTETAPRSCLKLPDDIKADMDSMKDEDGQGGVPVGMSRATWERVIEVCEAAIEERRDSLTDAALVALERNNLFKRISSGWQRAMKCAKERAALSAAVEVAPDAAHAAVATSPRSSRGAEKLPAEKEAFECPVVQRGALPVWWNTEADADLLRGSLRHGFSPWSADMLEDQFEAIREDPTLLFAREGCEAPADEEEKKPAAGKKEKEKSPDGEDDASPAEPAEEEPSGPRRMPGRETLKRRVLKLLELLVNPREPPPPKPPKEVKPKPPTKKELKAMERERQAEERKRRDRERAAQFEASLTGKNVDEVKAEKAAKATTTPSKKRDESSKNDEAPEVDKENTPGAKRSRLSIEPAVAKPEQPTEPAEPAEPEHHAEPEAKAKPEPKAPKAKPKAPKAEPKAPKAGEPKAAKAGEPKAAKAGPKAAKAGPKAAKAGPKAAKAGPEAAKPEPEVKPAEAEAKVSPVAAAPSAPPAAAPSSAEKTSPLAAADANTAATAAAPIAAAAFAAPTPSARAVSAARMTASALSADQDPLATLVLPSLNISRPSAATPAANKPKTSFLHTPSDLGSAGSGFKRAGIGGKTKGGGAKGSLAAAGSDAKQKSLFGFFAKTPAPSAADRPRTVQTPTTGGF